MAARSGRDSGCNQFNVDPDQRADEPGGEYSVVVSNIFGVTTSQTATLTVYRAPSLADHDLSRDFSLAGNPNGAWSYGWQNTIGGAFTLLGTAKTNFANVPIILGPSARLRSQRFNTMIRPRR
jgi:hypothetical protein